MPRVGERIRNKRYGTIWKIIEEKETWLKTQAAELKQLEPMPAIYLRFWQPEPSDSPGTGKTMEYRYSVFDTSFHAHWEVMYD